MSMQKDIGDSALMPSENIILTYDGQIVNYNSSLKQKKNTKTIGQCINEKLAKAGKILKKEAVRSTCGSFLGVNRRQLNARLP